MKSVGEFGIGEVVSGVVRCLKVINSDCELPTSLPQNMAQRFRVAASVAQAIKVCFCIDLICLDTILL